MSKDNNISLYKRGEEEIFNRRNKMHENLINLKKKSFIKKSELLNNINDNAKIINNFHFLMQHKKNKKLESIAKNKIINYSSFRKPNDNMDKSKKKIYLASERVKEKGIKAKKNKLPHLIIDSYNKKVKFSIQDNFYSKINQTLNKEKNNIKTNIHYLTEDKNKENNNCKIKLKMKNNFYRKRAKSAVNIHDSHKKLKRFFNLPSKFNKKRKKSQIFSHRIITNNSTCELNSKKYKSKNVKKKKSSYNNIKYSNNFVKDSILKTILNNQNLRILYQTDEIRIKKMIRSQNKKNKQKYTIFKYQKNLLKNSISPLNEDEKYKLMKTFSKINRYAKSEKKINLHKYLKDIQKKEKIIITSNNNLNENCVNNMKKIGNSKDRHLLKYEKVLFQDIFKKRKLKL